MQTPVFKLSFAYYPFYNGIIHWYILYFYNWKHPPPTNSLNSELAGTLSLPIPTK